LLFFFLPLPSGLSVALLIPSMVEYFYLSK
jgi:hypothetical protein